MRRERLTQAFAKRPPDPRAASLANSQTLTTPTT